MAFRDYKGRRWVKEICPPWAGNPETSIRIYYIEGDYFCAESHKVSGRLPLRKYFKPSIEEINGFMAEVLRREEEEQKRNEKERELLALCGLKHDDFVRIRDVFIDKNEPGVLCVSTRENGVNGRSVEAIRNSNYLSSEPDEGDRTYEWYRFAIPKTD